MLLLLVQLRQDVILVATWTNLFSSSPTLQAITTAPLQWRYDIQQHDTLHNDTQHSDTQHNDSQHNTSQHNDTQRKKGL
jgi:hypothetical protein